MSERTYHNCVYVLCDPGDWLRRRWAGEPMLPRCANHPRWPGQLRDVPGVPCTPYSFVSVALESVFASASILAQSKSCCWRGQWRFVNSWLRMPAPAEPSA